MATNKDIDLHEENGSVLVATAITLLTLSWFSVGLRTYTRAVLMKSLQLDDWLMLVAQVNSSLHYIGQHSPRDRSSSRYHVPSSLKVFSRESESTMTPSNPMRLKFKPLW